MVATRLKGLDKVAYIRFSSVFKRFVDVEDFEKEVKKLIK
jgi:transcriptional repressor NrdR